MVDGDELLRRRLGRGLASRGFEPLLVDSVASAAAALSTWAPAFAIVDTHLPDGSGLAVVQALRKARRGARIIVLTGHGSIASAVAAMRAGAIDYLSKPAEVDDVSKALLAAAHDQRCSLPDNIMSADRVRWEHIHRIYELCDHNVSETARRLTMHRRTLQRILGKRAPR